MAKGYSSIIAKYDDRYFENWIRFISEQFILWEGDKRIVILTEDGDEEIVELLSVEQAFREKHQVVIKFRNSRGRTIAARILQNIKSFIVEYYSMDELLDDEDHNMFYNCLLERFVELSKHTQVGGFVFDRDGYTEDYIQFY